MFLTFSEHYGVPKTGLFQTVDLFEGTNMPQVLSCIQQLGTEVRIMGDILHAALLPTSPIIG